MRLRPQSKAQPEYPSRRDFLRRAGLVAAGVGLGAMTLPPAEAGERLRGGACPPPKKAEKAKKAFCAKTCGKEIDAQVKLLGSKDFKVRKKATARLIAVGKAEDDDTKTAAQKKALVLAKMEKLKAAKDPEIAQRARTVILAITPVKKKVAPPRRNFEIPGSVILEVDPAH